MQAGVGILLIEAGVDWIKHSFITKFNQLDAKVFQDFKSQLCEEYVSFRIGRLNHVNGSLFSYVDKCDSVSRALGFVPLPLICLVRFQNLSSLGSFFAGSPFSSPSTAFSS
jgi:hypothetical protein